MINPALAKLAETCSQLMSPCRVCPRQCLSRRLDGEKGFCGVAASSHLCKKLAHFTEEAELVPTFSLYFSGCNMRCQYCSNSPMMKGGDCGDLINHQNLAAEIDQAAEKGAKTLFLLGGEPACSLLDAINIIAYLKNPIPVVWNSNMYLSPEAFSIVMEISDIFLADLKFGCQSCASELADTPDYLQTVRNNIKRACDSGKRVIIRHLPLAGHLQCCTLPTLEWIAAHCPEASIGIISLMPPPNSKPAPPSPEELSIIHENIDRLRLHQVSYRIPDNPLPDPEVKTRSIQSLLHIRKDGSIAAQDVPAQLLAILDKLARHP